MKAIPLLVFSAVLAAACSSPEVPRGGTFVYDCGVKWDPGCAKTAGTASIPSKVAVGSQFAIRYVATSGRFTLIRFEPEGILDGEPAYLRARSAGKVDIVAIDYDSDTEIDRTSIQVAEPTKIKILDLKTRGVPKTKLDVGDDLQVFPLPEADDPLAGALPTEFTVDPPGALVRDEVKPGWFYRVKKAGTVVLTARAGRAQGSLELDVHEND